MGGRDSDLKVGLRPFSLHCLSALRCINRYQQNSGKEGWGKHYDGLASGGAEIFPTAS